MACSPGIHPEYTVNLETAKKILELQGSEADIEAQLAMFHEDVQWQPAFHGSKTVAGTGTGNAISGVSNNGSENGTVTWTPTSTGTYYYQCSLHGGMVGTITIQ